MAGLPFADKRTARAAQVRKMVRRGCNGRREAGSRPKTSARKPLLHTRGICRARSSDLEVTPWPPTRLTSCIFHSGPEEASGASTLEPGPRAATFRLKLPPESARECRLVKWRKPALPLLTASGRPDKNERTGLGW